MCLPRRSVLAASVLLCGACASQWPASPAGAHAEAIGTLWWIFLSVTASVWLATMSALVWAVLRGRRRAGPALDEAATRMQARSVGSAVAASLVLLFLLAGSDLVTTRRMLALEREEAPLTVRVEGLRWWWDLTYEPEHPARRFRTANELTVPVGSPVLLELQSRDVIHSLWIPRLNGKRDLVPGYTTRMWIRAQEPGVYQGECAEFCGLQHAKMRLRVVALPPDSFEAWRASQLAPAAEPRDSLAARGREVFVGGSCALCHAVRGTPARGQVAPDLTHLAVRRTLAAGTLPNTRGNLAAWIVDPQHHKSGADMPPNVLRSEDLHALVHWLETLR